MPDANDYLRRLISGHDYVTVGSREEAEKVRRTAARPSAFEVEQVDGVWIVRYTGEGVMEEEKGTLNITTDPDFDPTVSTSAGKIRGRDETVYKFRADRVETLEEVARLLEALQLSIVGEFFFESFREDGVAHLFEKEPTDA